MKGARKPTALSPKNARKRNEAPLFQDRTACNASSSFAVLGTPAFFTLSCPTELPHRLPLSASRPFFKERRPNLNHHNAHPGGATDDDPPVHPGIASFGSSNSLPPNNRGRSRASQNIHPVDTKPAFAPDQADRSTHKRLRSQRILRSQRSIQKFERIVAWSYPRRVKESSDSFVGDLGSLEAGGNARRRRAKQR